MPREYKHLTPDEQRHFVEHGWIHVRNGIKPQYIREWMADFWTRLGWDEHDPSTWQEPYLKMPRHREVRCEEFCPEAWAKMCEIVGGEDKVDDVRERWYGDQFICSFGGDERWGTEGSEVGYADLEGWHTDNDWYRYFLDSSGNALTIIFCFTDVLPRGGGTVLAEDGIKGVCETLYNHPEGLDPPCSDVLVKEYVKQCKQWAQVEAEAGDVFITHGFLPHSHTTNHLPYARVITNPHVNLKEPWNLNREDGDYTLCEQVILRALNRTSIPEYKPTRPREASYPRTAYFKRARVPDELERMVAAARAKGLGLESVDSVYLRGEAAILEHERRNGYDKPVGVHGVVQPGARNDEQYHHPGEQWREILARIDQGIAQRA